MTVKVERGGIRPVAVNFYTASPFPKTNITFKYEICYNWYTCGMNI